MDPNDQDQGPKPVSGLTGSSVKFSGLSGNEMYCAALLGYSPSDLLVGNSVYSMGYFGSLRANVRTFVGGEITTMTNMIAEGRKSAIEKFNKELTQCEGSGATGMTSEILFHPGNAEFLTVGSAIASNNNQSSTPFTTSADAQELFCQWDAGYQPLSFAFGNVAYSIGAAKGLLGSIRELAKGEVKQFSDVFNQTRNLALERIVEEAKSVNANSVVGIRTSILPIGVSQTHEMLMIGTASYNQQIANVANVVGGVTTSDLTAEETWNIAKMGYAPLKLVLGTSVYSLGVAGGIKATFANLVKGEINSLTEMIYGAREQSLNRLKEQAEQIGADDVLGIKNYIYAIDNGMVEFLSIGTAVKKIEGINTRSQQLPPQAIIRDKDTYVNTANMAYGADLQNPQK